MYSRLSGLVLMTAEDMRGHSADDVQESLLLDL
jgi:hypothetical protein